MGDLDKRALEDATWDMLWNLRTSTLEQWNNEEVYSRENRLLLPNE